MNDQAKREFFKTVAPYALFMLAFVLMCVRSVYGFGFTDESASFATVERFANGQSPFLDDWSQEQLYALLVLPLYTAYVALCGSTTGIYLVFRLAAVLISLVVAVAAFHVFRREYSPFVGMCIALVFMLYAHNDVLGLSRYTLCCDFFMLGLVCAWYALHRMRDMRDTGEPSAARVLEPLLAGAFFALACVCNPCIIVIFLGACLAGLVCAVVRSRARLFMPFAWAMVGGVLVACCYLFALLQFAAPIDIVNNIPNLILEYLRTTELDICATSFLAALSVNTAAFIVTWALVVFLVFWRMFGLRVSMPFRCIVLAVDALCLAASCVTAATDANASSQVFIAFVEFALPCFLLAEEVMISVHYNSELHLLWIPGLALSLAWHFCASGQGNAMEIGMMFACMGAFVTVMKAVPRPAMLMAHSHSQAAPPALRGACMAVIAVMVLVTGGIRVFTASDDCAWGSMATSFSEGPGAGIVTSTEHLAQYNELAETLEVVGEGERVWVASGLVWGYLECSGECAVPDLWRSSFDEEATSTYYGDSRRAAPEWIFVADRGAFNLKNTSPFGNSDSNALASMEVGSIKTVDKLEADGEYVAFATNSFGKLYKRTEFSAITQG